MPRISVAGVTIAYELWGQGATVVFTPGGWFPRNDFAYLMAGRLSAQLADYADRYTPKEIQQVQESDSFVSQHSFLYLPYIEEFLQKEG